MHANNANSALHNSNTNASSYLSSAHRSIQSLHGATYEAQMPIDYLHLLNCVCIYYVAKTKDCWDAGSYIEIPATRLTADSWSQIITDIYNRPSPMRPYYYIHNQNSSNNNAINQNLPTNPISKVVGAGMPDGTDMSGNYKVVSTGYTEISIAGTPTYILLNGNVYTYASSFDPANPGNPLEDTPSNKALTAAQTAMAGANVTAKMVYPAPTDTVAKAAMSNGAISDGSNFPRTFKLDLNGDGDPETNVSLVEKPIALRAGNTSNVRIEIRYGKDDTIFQLKELQIDYVKTPQYIRLTQEQIDLTEDTSQIMEFPDYVNQEIINELVHLVMERTNDPRLSNNMSIDQTIARPNGQSQSAPAQAKA